MLRLRSHTDPDKFLKRRIFHLSKPFIRNRANCALFSIQKLTRFLGSIPCKRKANPLKFLSVQDFPWTRVNHLCSHTLRLIKKKRSRQRTCRHNCIIGKCTLFSLFKLCLLHSENHTICSLLNLWVIR